MLELFLTSNVVTKGRKTDGLVALSLGQQEQIFS